MIWGRSPVKRSNRDIENTGQRRSAAPVWLSGWTLAIPSVGVAAVAALLAVPRATKPVTVPQPVTHRLALDAVEQQLERRADRARSQSLPFAVREVGEAYRRLGRSQYEGLQPLDGTQAVGWQRLVSGVRASSGDEALLTLRAVQAQMLVSALTLWESTGKVPDDLIELGGDFVRLARSNHWWRGDHLDMSRDERWALAMLRWTSLAGLSHVQSFRLDTNLEVIQLRFLYLHAARDGSWLKLRQKIVQRYAELDPNYPVDFARGVLFAEAGQLDAAAASFTRHLQGHPDGAYATRARNHLLWTVEQARDLEGDDGAR